MNKLLIITGPTATGKTSLAIKIAKKFPGEIISADSRQVYEHMDIVTGKDRDEYIKNNIPIWGIDLVDPDYSFNVSDFVSYATKKITDIQSRNKLPIIVGGTALYIKALLDPFQTIDVPPNEKLRNALSKYSLLELQKELQKIDKNKWEKMNDSDRNNPRRLIRAIEVATAVIASARSTRGNPIKTKEIASSQTPRNDVLIISLTAPYSNLYKRIDKRVDDRVKQGAVDELQNLLKLGYHFSLPSMSASGYKEFKSVVIKNELATGNQQLATCVQNWKYNEHAYARRQNAFIKKFLKSLPQDKVMEINIQNSNHQRQVWEKIRSWYINGNGQRED